MPRVTQASTKARKCRDDQSRRSTVLDAAETAFVEEGYQGTTTDRIAARAEVSVGTVYNFCGSKEKLYAAVVSRIGGELVDYVERSVLPVADPAAAVELLIRFRLANFDRHRLLLILFSGERVVGSCPPPESMPGDAKRLYYSYLDAVGRVFAKGMERGIFARMHPLHLALSFEGMLNAFVGYWLGRGHSRRAEVHSRRLTETFLSVAGIKPVPEGADSSDAMSRQVFVTSFDASRLQELITVARAFGSEDSAAHLDELEAELNASRVVESAAVPRDVVTMSSRLRLRLRPEGGDWCRTLAFPADVQEGDENISVLTPLGTALLGCRVGDVVEAEFGGRRICCEVAELLYQPEAAGDFHR